MLWVLSILAFVIIFSLLILIHECGHFFMAKRVGIKVEEFGLGMPPRLWGFRPKKSDTLYSINAIPFGGFVRLYGEDLTDKKSLNSKKSFAGKKPWQKLLVVSAGVVMNFLLAYVLLVLGFSIGMQPLLATSEDVFQGINSGVVKVSSGVIIKATGTNDIGFLPGDRIVAVNDRKVVLGDEVMGLKDQEQVIFQIQRGHQLLELKGVNDLKKPFFEIYDLLPLPQLVVKSVSDDEQSNFRQGEIIGSVNGQRVFTVEQLSEILKQSPAELVEPAGWVTSESDGAVLWNYQPRLVISMVLPGAPAAETGLQDGDEVVAINGVVINSIEDLPMAIGTELIEGKAVYKIRRGASEIEYFVRGDEQGMIGVLLSEVNYLDEYGLSVYSRSVPYSVIEVTNVTYPFGQALVEAFTEIGRLSVFTGQTFVSVFGSIFTRFVVPEGVAGPVGIAQMTFVFVQEGFMSLIRFTALLSMSLAIINILPFPGLDGGRFVLILIPALFRKKINPRIEAMLHVFGFLLLMLLLLMVTFNDIARLFS